MKNHTEKYDELWKFPQIIQANSFCTVWFIHAIYANYHELKYSPRFSRCMCACVHASVSVVYYQLLRDAYWKSILRHSLLCGKINFEFVCNNVTVCFEHNRKYIWCVLCMNIFVCLEHVVNDMILLLYEIVLNTAARIPTITPTVYL